MALKCDPLHPPPPWKKGSNTLFMSEKLMKMSHVMKKTCLQGFRQGKPTCSATVTNQNLEILDIKTRGITLSKQRTTKVLFSLSSEQQRYYSLKAANNKGAATLLFAYGKKQGFFMTWLTLSNVNLLRSSLTWSERGHKSFRNVQIMFSF